MSKYPVNPKNVTNLTQPGEDKVFVGKRKNVELLPAILQTDTNKRFLDTTLDNLLSSGTTETINTYWGRVTGKDYNTQDVFSQERNAFRQNYQLAPGFSLKFRNDTIDSVSYQMLLNSFNRDGVQVDDIDGLFSEPAYTFAPPINIDMFINYHNYYWLKNDIPPCVISGTASDTIDIDSIVKQSQYTTPVLDNGKTLSLVNGMRVQFSGSYCTSPSGEYAIDTVYYVEGVGSKNITLIPSEDASGVLFSHIQTYTPRAPIEWDGVGDPWDTDPWDYSLFKSIEKEYVVMDRRSEDMNAWARANQWYSVYAIRNTVDYNDLSLTEFLRTEYRAQRPIIEFEPNIALVNSGTRMLGYIDHVISSAQAADIHGQAYYSVGNSALSAGNTVLLIDTNSFYDVSVVNDVIVLAPSTEYSALEAGDKLVMKNNTAVELSGAEIHWTGSEWITSQVKEYRSSAPEFKLFTENEVELSEFNETDYTGSTIFTYVTNSASVYDSELGLNPVYNSVNMNNDLVFESTINSTRYTRDIGSDIVREIDGEYYYKDNTTGQLLSGWKNIRESQQTPLLMTYIASADEYVEINIGTSDVGYSTEYVVVKNDNGNYTILAEARTGIDYSGTDMSTMLWKKDIDYSITQLVPNSEQLSFTCPFGTTTGLDIQVENNTTTLKILDGYAYDSVIYTNGTTVGYIYITADNQEKMTVKRAGVILQRDIDYTFDSGVVTFIEPATENEVFEVTWKSNQSQPDKVHDIADIVKYNPNNESLGRINHSDLFPHFSDQLNSMPGFYGRSFGENGYHSMPRVNEYGGLIRKQVYSPTKMTYTSSDSFTDVFNALPVAMRDYENFKSYFTTKVKQLWKSMPDAAVYQIVDEALTQINLGKNGSFKYTHSDMAYYNDFVEDRHFIRTDSNLQFEMTNVVNEYNGRKNHVYVILNEFDGDMYSWRMLDASSEYTIDGTTITLTNTPILDSSNNPGQLVIRFKPIGASSWIPSSPAKLGFSNLTTVEIVDGYLIGHDGSKRKCSGTNFTNVNSPDFDIQTACLMDLEKRFFAGVASATTSVGLALPSANEKTPYSWTDTRTILDDTFNIWKYRNDIESLTPDDYYDADNYFTWNYSSVYPYIGGWRGVYTYYFDTTRPHTHPWEMLGYGVKPTWWNTHYSWTDLAKRTALINALAIGQTSEPGQPIVINPNIAKKAYDWFTKELVTMTGELNDPITSGVVEMIPEFEAVKEFEFGDWGPVECDWRNTSEYKFSLVRMMLKLKPFSTYENMWSQYDTVAGDTKIHGYVDDSNYVLDVEVKSGGNGYTTAPTVNSTTTSAGDTNYVAHIKNGSVVGVSVVKNTAEYTDNIQLEVNGNANIIARTGELVHVDYGINSVISEYAIQLGISPDQLATNIDSVVPEMTIHVGGYTDKNILNIMLDSSYQKGRVDVPKTDFDIILKKSAPIKSVYYSGIRVRKLDYGYQISGFDINDQTFKYIPMSMGGTATKVSIGDYELVRYHKFQNTINVVPYGTVFKKRQDLYNFVLGLAEYYESQGFRVRDNWLVDASSLIYWSLDTTGDLTDEFVINGTSNGDDDTLVFEQGTHGYVDYVGYTYGGQASILDTEDNQISPKNMLVLRDSTTTEFSLKTGNNNIHGLSVNVVEYEHLIPMSNVTEFNDVIFNPVTGIQHTRIKLEGERTRNWNGRLEAPGYIVRTDGITTNFESTVREIERDSVNTTSKTLNKLTRQTARFNVGHIQPSYLINTFVEDSASYEFDRGVRKYKGTPAALNAIMRNKNIFNGTPEFEYNEDWMIALGDYGDKSKRDSVEFTLEPSLLKSNPQVIRFNSGEGDDLTDTVIDIQQNDSNVINGDLSRPFDLLPYERAYTTTVDEANIFQDFLPTSKMPLASDNTFVIKSKDDIASVYDVTAEYANIPNWSPTRSYKLGDRVRLAGKVYELTINSTGVQLASENIVVRGSTIFPVIPSGSVLTLDGVDINFSKTTSTTTFNQIVLDGTVINPTVANNSTLSIDGTIITFEKTDTSIVYNPIEYLGSVVNPLIQGTAGKELLIDGVTIDFENQTSAVTNITAKSAIETPISTYGIPSVTASNLAVELINATDNLRIAYETTFSNSAWMTWIDNYFSSNFPGGLNMPYLEIERDNAVSGYETALLNFIIANVKIINAIQGTTYDVTDSTAAQTVTVANNDAVAAEGKLSTGNFIDNYAQYVESGQALQTSTIVATTTSPVTTIWDLQAIVDKINETMPVSKNIVASAVSGRIKLIKQGAENDSNLIIGTASANTEVGFTAQIIAGTLFEQTSGGILTLDEIVQKINAVGLSGISSFNVDGHLRIISTNQTLLIGTGNNSTANSSLGIVSGPYTASTSSSTNLVDLTIFDIVSQINASNVDGITAANINNNIVLTSINPTLTITETSASNTIGFMANTFTANEIVANTFNSDDWLQLADPAIFSIQVLDGVGTNNTNASTLSGYNVYQVLDFNLEINEVCAGNRTGDDAMISITEGQHNLQTDDLVMVINSACTPAIDGIHRVTGVELDTHFYVDKYIEELGYGGKLLVLRPVRFTDNITLSSALQDVRYRDGGLGIQPGTRVYIDSYINTSSNVITLGQNIDEGTSASFILNKFYQFELERVQTKKADNTKLKNAVVYDYKTDKTIETLEVFDPAKGIIPGIADAEIKYKSNTDIAMYNSTTDENYTVTDNQMWDERHVGEVWWDTSNAVYWDYEQGDIVYSQSFWGRLMPLSSIDMYEWVKSPVLPDLYESAAGKVVDGVELTGAPLTRVDQYGQTVYYWTEQTEYDGTSDQEETYYYFWVKNKTTVPNKDRNYSVIQLADIITDPTAFGIDWVALAGVNTVLFSNMDRYINDANTVIQLNFNRASDIDLHREYLLLTENDDSTVIPEWLHNGLRDSLAEFDRATRTESFRQWNNTQQFTQGMLVKSNLSNFYRAVVNNTDIDPDTDTSLTWARVYDAIEVVDDYESTLSVKFPTPQPVPDTNLHPFARYGIQIKPRQTWIKNVVEARRVLIDKINRQLADITLIDHLGWDTVLGTTLYWGGRPTDMTVFWDYVDWQVPAFDTTVQPDIIATYRSGLPAYATEGQVALVQRSTYADGINRTSMYKVIDGVWELQYKQKATIQFNSLLWDYERLQYGWDSASWDIRGYDADPGAFVGEIIDTIKNHVFVGQYLSMYADMWFTMLRYINSEQPNIDWAFKSTYIKAKVNYALESTDSMYRTDSYTDLISYINSVKPFHTKLRDLATIRDVMDTFSVSVVEEDSTTSITLRTGYSGGNIVDSIQAPQFTDHTEVTQSSSMFTDTDIVVYDGGNFDTTANLIAVSADNLDDEVDTDLAESLEILVYTSTVPDNSQALGFRMHYNAFGDEESSVIVPFNSLAEDITAETTEIKLTAEIPTVAGIVWIGHEQVAYTHVVNNTLMNAKRGYNNTSEQSHAAGTIVYKGGPTVKLNVVTPFRLNGDDLTPAYNQFGSSIVTDTPPNNVISDINRNIILLDTDGQIAEDTY